MGCMAFAKPSMQRRMGGRPGALSSDISSWKIGQAMSGSWAPRAQRPERVREGGRGVGIVFGWGGWVRRRVERWGFDWEILDRRVEV